MAAYWALLPSPKWRVVVGAAHWSSMKEISRDPHDLVVQTRGAHHQYPDGFMLFLGTLFAPVEDRDAPGQGVTHNIGDVVTISNDKLGALGLSSGIATTSLKHATHFKRNAEASMVMVNLPTAGVDFHVPFGTAANDSSRRLRL